MTDYWIPTLGDVYRARNIQRRRFAASPLVNFPALDKELGLSAHLKLENLLPTGSFKIRGATYLISQLAESERKAGVVAASTGNFSQGVTHASISEGISAKIVMPENSNRTKVQATLDLGGEIVFHGSKFDDALKYAQELAEKEGRRYIHSANEPLLIAGVGVHTLELLEQNPETDAIIVPVGGGSGVCGASIVAKSVDPSIKVIGVQSDQSPAAYRSWKERKIVSAANNSFAEGLATGEGYEYTQDIMKNYMDDFILVSDQEIREAMKQIASATRIFPESASASSLAALNRMKAEFSGMNVALIITGGNSPAEQMGEVLS